MVSEESFDAGKREAEMEALARTLMPESDRAVRFVDPLGGDDAFELPLAGPQI